MKISINNSEFMVNDSVLSMGDMDDNNEKISK